MSHRMGIEKILTFFIAVLFLGIVVAITILNAPIGDSGDSFSPEDVNTRIILDHGHIQDPSIPEGLLILGVGQEAALKFEVFNIDPDNDIDTIEVKIPGSEISMGSSEWFRDDALHQWPYQITETDTITFEAQEDFQGTVGGDVPYYDTAGNVDDALDFIENYDDGDNPIYDLSEGITLTVTFDAPETPGLKMGEDAINLRVGDLKTEDPGVPLTTFEPFPYPYIAAEVDDTYQIIVLKTSSCHLEVEYGEEHLFSYTRGTDVRTSEYGYEYVTDTGSTVAVLKDPGDTLVNPLVRAKEDGLVGKFVLDMYKIKITDTDIGYVEKIDIVSDYKDDMPSQMGDVVDNDLDDDGALNNIDDDMDGDDIPNSEDNFPKTYNRMPAVTDKTENLTVKENEIISLMVEANDPEMEDVTYTWTHDKDSSWTASENEIDIFGFEPGTYIFTVTIGDEFGNTRTETIKVVIEENLAPVISAMSAEKTEITEGDDLVLSVEVTDPEGDVLTYTWTHDKDENWKETGNPLTVKDLGAGDYTFTVTVTDDWSNVTGTIDITVKEGGGVLPLILIIILIVVILIIILVVVLLVLRRKKTGAEEERIAEMTSQEIPGQVQQQEMPPESYYEDFYDPNDEDMNTGSYSPEAQLEVYADDNPPIQADTYEDATVMEYPQDEPQEGLPGPEPEAAPLPEIPQPEPLPSASLQQPEQDAAPEETASPPVMPPIPPTPPPIPVVPEMPKKEENEGS